MPAKQISLRPGDLAVALQLMLTPDLAYMDLASRVSMSYGETHNAVKRLQMGKMVRRDERRAVRRLLFDFVIHGVRHVWPAMVGPEARGIRTAAGAPALEKMLSDASPMVWPFAVGKSRGRTLTPLYPGAPRTQSMNPPLYDLLTLVDAMRTGRARERSLAAQLLEEKIVNARP